MCVQIRILYRCHGWLQAVIAFNAEIIDVHRKFCRGGAEINVVRSGTNEGVENKSAKSFNVVIYFIFLRYII